jgi:hypothetical protein
LTTHTKKLHRQISLFLQLREAVIVFAAENRYGSEADLQQLRMQEDESLFILGLQELLKAGDESIVLFVVKGSAFLGKI